ncbi:hypothetical protein PDM28_02985 [Stenotrophomonas aracearum]|uniref:DUF2029 domain-containing protein n=1 Tax=Stenotrophomonas aracearum TaxID=3003272 RepID=A0ABY9YEM1_9GAMM|nr:hypothetical protein [Stenotrophomonas sp. A5588]WNH49317.1 hypothetical protein PDM28_02985 [Stenotrophomonas sp. A5588]
MFSLTATDGGARAALGMLAGVLLCYAFAAFGWVGLPAQIAFIAVLACAVWSLLALRDGRAAWMVGIVAVLLVLALGSPTDEWDPRSIWMLHAKRIYLENSLYAQLDNYAIFSHNDYPSLMPLWSATAAKVVGHWNEIFPKAAATLLLLPPLLLIARSLRTWWVAGLFAVAVLEVGGRYLVDGYMDAFLAVYAVAALAVAIQPRRVGAEGQWFNLAAYAALSAVLTLIKNEGAVLAILVGLVAVATVLLRDRRIPWALLAAFALSMVPLVAWKLAVAGADLGNDLAQSDLKGQLLARLPDLTQSVLILKALLRSAAWVPLVLLLALWARMWRVPAARAALAVALAYFGVLFAVYLSTPHDLVWHLATSAKRVALPVQLLLMYGVLVLLDQWKQAAPRQRAGERNA